jgi:hypothetical protein
MCWGVVVRKFRNLSCVSLFEQASRSQEETQESTTPHLLKLGACDSAIASVTTFVGYERKKMETAPIICMRVEGSFSQNPETTFLLGPGGMHVEHHAASAPRYRGASDQHCVEMIT